MKRPISISGAGLQAKAEEDGYGSKLTPEIVMNYASAPINLARGGMASTLSGMGKHVEAATQTPRAAGVHRGLPGYRRRQGSLFMAGERQRQLRRFAAVVQKSAGAGSHGAYRLEGDRGH